MNAGRNDPCPPAVLVLATEECVLSMELLGHPPSTADEVAQLISDAIAAQIARGSVRPSRLTVRHNETGDALASRLRGTGEMGVNAATSLP